MRTIKDMETVTVTVSKKDLIEGKWIPFTVLSDKLKEIEKEKNMGYKSLRIKLYNSFSSEKYNTDVFATIKCVNTENPMKAQSASLMLNFKKVD